MVLAEVTMGFGALKGAYEVARGLKDVDDKVRINAAVIEIQEKILTAQEGAAAARERLTELEGQLAAYKSWDAIAVRYALRNFGDDTFAYEFVVDSEDDTPAHLACPNCFQKRERSILQFRSKSGARRFFVCPACEKTFPLGAHSGQAPTVRRGIV